MKFLATGIVYMSLLFSTELLFKESTIADSLPKNMPIIKKVFWGEKGMLRGSFFDPKSRIKELKIRRNMLQMHQRLSLLTLGLMVHQYDIGKRMLDSPYEYGELKDKHMKLGYTVFGTYMAAASLSIFAPPGMKYSKKKFTSNKLHRYLAVIHFTGMAMQPWLGYKTSVAGLEGRVEDRERLLDLHDTVGGITLSAYVLAFLTTLLK